MITHTAWINDLTLWLYLLVAAALALRVLYLFFTRASHKRTREADAGGSAGDNGSTAAMLDNERGFGTSHGVGDCGDSAGGGDGGD